MFEIYMRTFIVFALITFLLQVIMLSMISQNPSKRVGRWNRLFGFSLATMISTVVFILLMSFNAADIGASITVLIISLPFFIAHMVILILTGLKKDNYKPDIIKFNKQFVITALIVLLITGVSIVVPMIIRKTEVSPKNYNLMYASEHYYLTKKYGDQNFEVVGDGDEKTGPDTMFGSPRVLYHYALIKEPTSGANITVFQSEKGYKDNFIETYYPKLLEKYLQKHDVLVSFGLTTERAKIPDDFGHIPTLDELSKKMSNYDRITINKYDFENKDNDLNYIKELSYDLAKCLVKEFNIGKDVNLKFEFRGKNSQIFYYINIQNYNLVITDKEKNALTSLDLNKIE